MMSRMVEKWRFEARDIRTDHVSPFSEHFIKGHLCDDIFELKYQWVLQGDRIIRCPFNVVLSECVPLRSYIEVPRKTLHPFWIIAGTGLPWYLNVLKAKQE